MSYKVIIPPDVKKQIAKFHPALKQKIRATLDDLALDPYQGKALKEDLAGLYSCRVTRYRIIYSIHHNILEVHVIAIGHRRRVYQEIF